MDINKIAKEMTRKEFLNNIALDEDGEIVNIKNCDINKEYDFEYCPDENGLDLNKDCYDYKNCKECWENAIKDIKFKGEDCMEFDWEGFKNNKIAVHCDTEEKAKDFLSKCYKKGLFWSGDNKDLLYWNHHENNTCYNYSREYKTIQFSPKCFCLNYKDNNYTIIEWEIDKMDYDREYNIMEIMEFEEGTEFVSEYNRNVKFEKGMLKVKAHENEWIICSLAKAWLNEKFKLIKKDKKVSFKEAIQAYGKEIYCIWKNANMEEHKSIYCIKNEWEEILDFHNEYLSPKEILNGEWYIKEN